MCNSPSRSFQIALLAACVVLAACSGAGDSQELAVAEVALQRGITPAKELVISDPTVIESRRETTFDAEHPSGTGRDGAWSFGRLVHNMLPAGQRDSAAAASLLVMQWLKTWESDQAPNPTVSAAKARRSIRLLITNPWKAASLCANPESPDTDSDCVLDMARAPFKLLAIVNRADLRIVSNDGTAIGGEGRFVFQVVGPTLGVSAATGAVEVMDPFVKPQKFTVIFEYSLPVSSNVDTLTWANKWHQLGAIPFGEGFNGRLAALTNGFAGPDADPRRPNGNALDQLRTNEVALMGARFPNPGYVAGKQFWQLREFHLTAEGLAPHTVNLEPARDFDVARSGQTSGEGTRAAELISFLDGNAAAVLAAKHVLPPGMSGNSALVGSAPYGAWGKLVNPNPPSIPMQGVAHDLGDVAVDVRDGFALNTCAGCHRHETDTRHFMHVSALGALEPLSNVDDRTRIGVPPETPESATVVSNFLRAEISPGGARYEDFRALLQTLPPDLKEHRGVRACAPQAR